MASALLFARNCFSISDGTLKAASRTAGDMDLNAPILPAKCVNIGLQCKTTTITLILASNTQRFLDNWKREFNLRKTYLGVVMIENHSRPSGSAIFETTENLGTMNRLPALTVVSRTLLPSAPTTWARPLPLTM